jgi:hypothetical protein
MICGERGRAKRAGGSDGGVEFGAEGDNDSRRQRSREVGKQGGRRQGKGKCAEGKSVI